MLRYLIESVWLERFVSANTETLIWLPSLLDQLYLVGAIVAELSLL